MRFGLRGTDAAVQFPLFHAEDIPSSHLGARLQVGERRARWSVFARELDFWCWERFKIDGWQTSERAEILIPEG
jgi:hypothetical protein